MGNGVSGDQGNLPAHGTRDVREGISDKRHDWSELARTREIVTSPLIPTSYIGARTRGRKLSTDDHVGSTTPYIGVSNVGPKLLTEDSVQSEAYIGATTARLESSTGSSIHVDASGAESIPTVGNMYDIAEHECDDAMTSEFNTGNTSRLQRRFPETREDKEQSSVMKDDTQSGKYGDIGLRHRKKKEDRHRLNRCTIRSPLQIVGIMPTLPLERCDGDKYVRVVCFGDEVAATFTR